MAHIVSPLCVLSDSVSCCDPPDSLPSLLAGHHNTQTGETNSMSEIDNPFLHFTHSNLTSSDFGKLSIVINIQKRGSNKFHVHQCNVKLRLRFDIHLMFT